MENYRILFRFTGDDNAYEAEMSNTEINEFLTKKAFDPKRQVMEIDGKTKVRNDVKSLEVFID